MKLHPRLSCAAVPLVTRFETFHPIAQPTAGGGWTIGFGHTLSAREGAHISRADAEALLLYDLARAAETVDAALYAPVSQDQFDALSAFCFNIGAENFRRSSALARVNAGADLDAADEIERWRRAELGAGAQVVDALFRRRAAEKAHFLGLPEGFSKSPSAVLRPIADVDETPRVVPPEPPSPPPSAVMDAANSVQARLRELVPDPPAPPFEPAPVLAPDFHTFAEDEALGTSAQTLEPATSAEELPSPALAPAQEPAVAAAYVAASPVECASPELADDDVPPPPAAPSPVEATPQEAVVSASPVTPVQEAAVPSRSKAALAAGVRFLTTARGRSLLLAALGSCLLVAAVMAILGTRPGLANLALAIAGVLVMIPGIYGLLGSPEPKP